MQPEVIRRIPGQFSPGCAPFEQDLGIYLRVANKRWSCRSFPPSSASPLKRSTTCAPQAVARTACALAPTFSPVSLRLTTGFTGSPPPTPLHRNWKRPRAHCGGRFSLADAAAPRSAPMGNRNSTHSTRRGRRYRDSTRYRSPDGRLRTVTCTAPSEAFECNGLIAWLLKRNDYGDSGCSPSATPSRNCCCFRLKTSNGRHRGRHEEELSRDAHAHRGNTRLVHIAGDRHRAAGSVPA